MYYVTIISTFDDYPANIVEKVENIPEAINYTISFLDNIITYTPNERQRKFASYIKEKILFGERNTGYSIGRNVIGIDIVSEKEWKDKKEEEEESIKKELRSSKSKLTKLKNKLKVLSKNRGSK